jgi:hypothetical protein
MKKLTQLLTLFAILLATIGCGVSPEEKEQRKANAFDLAGRYEAPIGEKEVMVMNITNEGGDRSNILIKVDRKGLSDAEYNLVTQHGIAPATVEEKYGESFTIGDGKYEYLRGGENISDDLGESSRFIVGTHNSESLNLADGVRIDYTIEGEIKKSDYVIRGKITMSITKEEDEVDESGVMVTTRKEVGQIEIPFAAKSEGLFYQQYFGAWNGKMDIMNSELESSLWDLQITIESKEDDVLCVLSSKSQLKYKGVSYNLQKQEKDLRVLREQEYPLVELEFTSSNGNKIVLSGSIFSLGAFHGVVQYIDYQNNSETPLGSFQYKKD